ncbi:DNA primase small subunit isoform X3 [Cylas formicarius]|uniref:DNA primase small subunit isoform X3 n=1 Tax=Cylas formicarius TaxID=197179 RepID=UPI002958679A|nr:DNA primase small subunit isoform X3 [Cylas formicarius]
MTSEENYLAELLPLYYKRLFPSRQIYQWLSYGNDDTFSRREISFTLIGDIYIRFLSFNSHEEFVNELHKKFPLKIDIGAVYITKPKDRTPLGVLTPEEGVFIVGYVTFRHKILMTILGQQLLNIYKL